MLLWLRLLPGCRLLAIPEVQPSKFYTSIFRAETEGDIAAEHTHTCTLRYVCIYIYIVIHIHKYSYTYIHTHHVVYHGNSQPHFLYCAHVLSYAVHIHVCNYMYALNDNLYLYLDSQRSFHVRLYLHSVSFCRFSYLCLHFKSPHAYSHLYLHLYLNVYVYFYFDFCFYFHCCFYCFFQVFLSLYLYACTHTHTYALTLL